MIKLEKAGDSYLNVYWDNGKHIGTFELGVDGYYYFWQLRGDGAWQSYALRAIADKLDEVNKPFDNQVKLDFEEYRKDFEEAARVEYRKLLNESGMFFEFYPHLTGEYKKDKEQWLIEYEKLCQLRSQNF